jgi:hypothetical protein
MNFISWNTKQLINENTQNYFSADLINESISKTLKPVMNKMKKLNIGVPYRDARVFFFRFLQDKYPDLIPAGFETRKPAGKDVNALVGQIAMERPELLDKFGPEFDAYSREEVPGGLDRVSQFLNTAATMRQGKGVRQTAAAAAQTGGIKKDYSKLTAQEIADATTDAIKKKEAAFDAGDDVSDEKLLLKTAVGSVIAQLGKENVNQEALDNVAAAVTAAVTKINTLAEFERFLDYIADFEEYSVIYQYLLDTIDVIETNLGDMQSQKEDEEHEQEEAKPDYLDMDKDGNKKESMRAALKSAEGNHEQEESLVGKEAILDYNRPVMVVDHDGDKFVFVQDEDGRELKVPLSRLDFTASSENEESNIENTPLEELSILSPEEFEEVQNFENFNPNEWGYNTLQKFYFRKREGGEDEEFSTSQYMSKAPIEKREEAEEVRMSQLEINQHLAVQERQRVQNLYAQQRRHTHGY